MTKFIKNLWKIITFPFILAYKIIAYPVVLIHNANRFLNRELEEDRPFLETFSSIATEADARESLWEHIEVLRAHLLRIVVALVVGVGVSFYFSEKLMGYLAMPAGGLQKLQAIGVTEELGVFMRVALTSGIAIILPYLAFEIWQGFFSAAWHSRFLSSYQPRFRFWEALRTLQSSGRRANTLVSSPG
jgi:hypothetical protein